jgi:hypothetical protein
MTANAKLHPRGAGFLAAEHIYRNDCLPLPTAELYANIDFGKNAQNREVALNRGIASGWIARSRRGDICVTPEAVAYFDGLEGLTQKPQGQVAGPRVTMPFQDVPQISQKNIPNIHGTRDDVPPYSVRGGARFHTQA